MDPYTLLNLPPTATADDIRATYRRLAAVWHPDHQPPEQRAAAQERMVQLNLARDVLLDPQSRAQYHRQYEAVIRWKMAQAEAATNTASGAPNGAPPRRARSAAFMHEARRRRRQEFYRQAILALTVLGVLFFFSMMGLMTLAGDTPEAQFQWRAMWTAVRAWLVLGGSMVGALVFTGLLVMVLIGAGSFFRR